MHKHHHGAQFCFISSLIIFKQNLINISFLLKSSRNYKHQYTEFLFLQNFALKWNPNMQNIDLLFLLLGAVLVLAMHAGFAFLELGTVRHKNQVNALSKILTDFSLSAIAYFFVGYYISYGHHIFPYWQIP